MDYCSICLERVTLPGRCDPCGHFFCYECIHSWLLKNRDCPQCRRRVKQAVFWDKSENLSPANSLNWLPVTMRKILLRTAFTVSSIIVLYIAIKAFISTVEFLSVDDNQTQHSLLWKTVTFISMFLFEFLKVTFWLALSVLKFPFDFIVHFTDYINALVKLLSELFWVLVYVAILLFIMWQCGAMKRIHAYMRKKKML